MGSEVFEQGWPGDDTVCGWGSKMEHTETIRAAIPLLIKKYNIKTINDAGCGDLWWMRHVDLTGVDYVGYDIYERVGWDKLREQGWDLRVGSVVTDKLRPADLTICRDVFIHLPNHMITQALYNLRQTSKLLLATSFISRPFDDGTPHYFSNFNRMKEPSLKHAKLDMRHAPYYLGMPLESFAENYPMKSISLWSLE